LARSGRSREDFEIIYSPFVISGKDEKSFEAAREAAKGRISFYGSTPAYKNVLAVHGWGDLQGELNRMSKEGKWKEMGGLITDEMLNTFGIMGEPGTIVPEIKKRYGDFTDRTSGGFTFVDGEERKAMIADLKAV
ncbi:MAG: LLM class flavin-dependent oxidoreductase, partial [Pseudomonadales bacterium]